MNIKKQIQKDQQMLEKHIVKLAKDMQDPANSAEFLSLLTDHMTFQNRLISIDTLYLAYKTMRKQRFDEYAEPDYYFVILILEELLTRGHWRQKSLLALRDNQLTEPRHQVLLWLFWPELAQQREYGHWNYLKAIGTLSITEEMSGEQFRPLIDQIKVNSMYGRRWDRLYAMKSFPAVLQALKQINQTVYVSAQNILDAIQITALTAELDREFYLSSTDEQEFLTRLKLVKKTYSNMTLVRSRLLLLSINHDVASVDSHG
jgi:hypothetical protein